MTVRVPIGQRGLDDPQDMPVTAYPGEPASRIPRHEASTADIGRQRHAVVGVDGRVAAGRGDDLAEALVGLRWTTQHQHQPMRPDPREMGWTGDQVAVPAQEVPLRRARKAADLLQRGPAQHLRLVPAFLTVGHDQAGRVPLSPESQLGAPRRDLAGPGVSIEVEQPHGLVTRQQEGSAVGREL